MPSTEFETAAEQANSFTKRPSDDELLQLYGLYKQATVGDVNTPKPSLFDLKAKYKWLKWEGHKGKTQEDAEKEYIELVEKLKAKYA